MTEPITVPDRAALRPALDRFGFFALAFGSMIGVGWVTAMGSWLGQAGPLGAMLAFLAGGVVMLLIGLCYAEVTPMLPVAGGEVAYAYKAYGTGRSFVVGWFLAFGYISVSAFEAISVGKVLSYLFPQIDRWPVYELGGEPVFLAHLLLAGVFTALITALNYAGVAVAAAFQKWLIAGFLVVTGLFVTAGLLRGDVSNLEPLLAGGGGLGSLGGLAAVFVTVPFWFVGFDTIPQGAEEAHVSVPPRKLGGVILAAIACATLFYAVLILSVAMAGPWPGIVAAELPTARAFELAFPSKLWVDLVLVAALIGLLTSWNGFFLAASRVVFALGRGRIIPGRFGETHTRHGTPHRAVIFAGIFTALAPLLGRDALIAFVDVGAFCIGIAFLGVSLSVLTLRKRFPDVERPYRIPGGATVPYLAVAGSCLILAVMLVPGSPAALVWPIEVALLVLITVLGIGFWAGGRRARSQVTEEERAYLILDRFAGTRVASRAADADHDDDPGSAPGRENRDRRAEE